MKHPTCRLIAIILGCMAFLLAAVPTFANYPIEIEFVGVSPPVSGCVCQPVDIEVKAQDWDITTSEAGWDDLIFHAYPLGSWTPLAAPERDQDGWWHQTFRKTFDAPGEYPSAEDEYVFRAIDLDIFHGENDVDDQVVTTKVIVQDHYSPDTGISCNVTPTDGIVVRKSQEVTCTATAADADLKNCDESVPDTPLSYDWTESGGTFKNGVHTGPSVIWIAPATAGSYTVSVKVSDPPEPPSPGYCGTKNDPDKTKTISVNVSNSSCLTALPNDGMGGYWWDVDLDLPCSCFGGDCNIPTHYTLQWYTEINNCCEWITCVPCGTSWVYAALVYVLPSHPYATPHTWHLLIWYDNANGIFYDGPGVPDADWDPEVNVLGNRPISPPWYLDCPCYPEIVATVRRHPVSDPAPSECMACDETHWSPVTGGVQNDVHQTQITATVSPIPAGGKVNLSIQGPTGVHIPAGLSLTSEGAPVPSVDVPVGTDGKATAYFTSSDNDGEEVTINASSQANPITIKQKTCSHTTFECDPATVPADGVTETNIRFCLVKDGTTTPVAGHEIHFSIHHILDVDGNLVAGFPPEYGEVVQSVATTGTDGFATGVFRVGTEPGTIYFKAEDVNDQVP